MSGLDKKGPENQGPKTGRGLGRCSKTPEKEKISLLGKGMAKRNRAGSGSGQGKRLRSENKHGEI